MLGAITDLLWDLFAEPSLLLSATLLGGKREFY